MHEEVHPADYVREVVRNPPRPDDAAAHLTWIRVMAKVLMELNAWAPLFTLAACSEARTDDLLRGYCKSGAFEKSYFARIPAALCFLEWYVESPHEEWIKDLGRCEFWAKAVLAGAPTLPHPEVSGLHGDPPPQVDQISVVREIIGLASSARGDYLVVSHDVLETMQMMWGFADTSVFRVAPLLWLLQVEPLYVRHLAVERPGIVLFERAGEGLRTSFLELNEAV